jgi:hypothetical protein
MGGQTFHTRIKSKITFAIPRHYFNYPQLLVTYCLVAYAKHYELMLATMVWPHQRDAGGENTKINYGMDTTGEKEKRTSKENMDGRSKSSHDNKKFRTRSMGNQRGMAFDFAFPEDGDSCYKTGKIDRCWLIPASLHRQAAGFM